MKILHSSNVLLGKSFEGLGLVGDKLRVGIKRTFSKIIDLAISEKVDVVILSGETFDSLDISQTVLDFFLSEVQRAGKIPIVVLPGSRDFYQKGSFWDEWKIIRPAENLHLLIDTEKPYIELPDISTTVYGYPPKEASSAENLSSKIKICTKSAHHIAAIYGNIMRPDADVAWNYPLGVEDLFAGSFDYVALGGQTAFRNFSDIGLKAAYPGSPETLAHDQNESGNIIMINIEENKNSIEPRKVGSFIWQDTIIRMESIINMADLEQAIEGMSGPDVLLKVTLEGLTLFETGLDLGRLQSDLANDFLHLEFVDHTSVLPENVSAVKVQEKTILGQYLKVMVDKMNKADDETRIDLEKSLKIGYTLLVGKEIW